MSNQNETNSIKGINVNTDLKAIVKTMSATNSLNCQRQCSELLDKPNLVCVYSNTECLVKDLSDRLIIDNKVVFIDKPIYNRKAESTLIYNPKFTNIISIGMNYDWNKFAINENPDSQNDSFHFQPICLNIN